MASSINNNNSSGSNSHGRGWGLEFYDCIVNNDLARLEALVEQHRIDLDAKFTEVRKKNHLDLSPIHLVAYKGYTGMLQYLYDMNADIHQTTATLRRTAFHFAVLRHKMACFHKLLSFGANADPRDTFGNSPCHYAAEDGACDILDVLLRCKIDLNAQDITLKTPLMKATRNGKIDAVKKLLAAGCSLKSRDKNRDTALHFASRHGNPGIVALLIAAGSDVNAQNQWGNTPLMESVSYNNRDAVEKILKMTGPSCDLNTRDFRAGDTPLHIAVRKNYTVIADMLLASGRVSYAYNYQGELAIYDAVLNQKMDTLRLLLHHNYDFDRPAKLDYDGSGGKTVVKLALERGLIDVLHLLAQVGFALCGSPNGPERPPAASSWLEYLAAVSAALPSGRRLIGTGSISLSAPTTPGDQPEACTYATQKVMLEMHALQSLKRYSRRVIRKAMGVDIHRKVQTLPLPRYLKNYVLLKDLL